MDLKGNRMREWECVDWIYLAQDTDQWLRMGVCGLDSSGSGHGSVVENGSVWTRFI